MKTPTLLRKTKSLLVQLICCAALMITQNSSAQSGTSCADAINIGITDTCVSDTSSGTTFWYAFTADSSNLIFRLINLNSTDSAITQMILYNGDCSSLNAIDTSSFDLPGLIMKVEGLTIGNNYFLKLLQPNGNPSKYSICFLNEFSSLTTCTGCPSQLYDPNNTCELICNGSFEYFTLPPAGYSQIDRACPWRYLSGTSDLFNSAGDPSVNVPTNIVGNQFAHTGNGYAGFYAYVNNSSIGEYREYVTQQLNQPLINGQCYKLSFWVSLADNCNYAVDKIGAAFTSTLPTQPGWAALTAVSPVVVYNPILTNSSTWTLITINFTATGNEQYITIGQFFSDANTNITTVNHYSGDFAAGAYYFLDDVSLEPCCTAMALSNNGPVCTGSPFNLTATSNCQATNFSWSPINQIIGPNGPNVTATTSSAGNIFDCTMTLANYACTTTESILIIPDQTTIVNAGTDITICKNQSATITGTGISFNYGWSILNGPVLCSQCTTTIVSPTVTTSYVYHATNTHTGCTGYDTMTIFVNPLPPIHIVMPPGAVTCDGAFTFSATGVPSGANYLWHSNLPSVGTSSTFTVDWPNTLATNGYVILDVTDINGCTGHDSVSIPLCCCKGIMSIEAINDNVDSLIAHYPSSVIVSGNTTTITTQTLCINGILTVNRDLVLKNVLVSMGTNAKINILPGFTLTLEGTGNAITQQTIIDACDRMWDGIYINPTAILKVKDGTVIEDAKQAIVSINGGQFQIQGGGGSGRVKLNKNLVAVWVKPYNGTHTGYIRNTIISCDDPFQPGGTTFLSTTSAGPNLISPYNNTIGFIGVRIDSCTTITIGDSTLNNYRNLFERTRYGIFATRSNVNVWNNTFRFIQSTYVPSHSNPFPDGIAIYANNKIFVPIHTLTVGKPGTKKANNNFRECSYGVMAENQMNLNCEYNKFDSCFVISIFAQNNNNRTILINRDTLHDCTGINIDCYKVNNAFVTITNNVINQNANVLPINFGQTGIYVANSIAANTTLLVQNNSIKKMRNGIWVSRVNNAKIVDNGPITFIPGQSYTPALPATGIRVEQSKNVKVRNNFINYSQSTSLLLSNAMFGISINNCYNDTVTQNNIHDMGSGIYMKGTDNPSLIGCNQMHNCWYGINFASATISDQIRYGSLATPTPTGNTWNGCTNDLRGTIIPPVPGGINWWTNSFNAPTGIALTINSLTNFNNPIVLSSSDQCVSLLTPPNVSDSARREYLLEGICKTGRNYDTLSDAFTYNDWVFAYRTLKENPKWLNLGTNDDVYYQIFYNFHSNTNIGRLADVEDEIEVGNIINATAILNTITPDSKYIAEGNRKIVLEVYLHSWALDSMVLSDGQRETLLPIAHQGTIVGGMSVFDARNMLGIEVHDSSNVRISHPQEISNSEISVSHIFPNPASGQISIEADIPDGKIAELIIFDLTGRRVTEWQFIGGQKTYSFDASFLTGGMYIYCISTDSQIIFTDRLIIIKKE